MLRVCAAIESLRIPFDANAFRESQKEKDARIETVNGESGLVSLGLTHKQIFPKLVLLLHTLLYLYCYFRGFPLGFLPLLHTTNSLFTAAVL